MPPWFLLHCTQLFSLHPLRRRNLLHVHWGNLHQLVPALCAWHLQLSSRQDELHPLPTRRVLCLCRGVQPTVHPVSSWQDFDSHSSQQLIHLHQLPPWVLLDPSGQHFMHLVPQGIVLRSPRRVHEHHLRQVPWWDLLYQGRIVHMHIMHAWEVLSCHRRHQRHCVLDLPHGAGQHALVTFLNV